MYLLEQEMTEFWQFLLTPWGNVVLLVLGFAWLLLPLTGIFHRLFGKPWPQEAIPLNYGLICPHCGRRFRLRLEPG